MSFHESNCCVFMNGTVLVAKRRRIRNRSYKAFLDAIASLDWGFESKGGREGVITKPY